MLAERLFHEGNLFKTRDGHLGIDIQDSNHTFGEKMILVDCRSRSENTMN